MKQLAYTLAAKIPDRVWTWFSTHDCLLPYYHMVSDEYVPHVSPLYRFRSVSEFKTDLDFFLKSRRPVSLDEYLHSIRNTKYPPRRSFLLTFDDGFREMHDVVLPILKAKGVPAVFFITSSTVDNREMCHHQVISLILSRRNEKDSPTADRAALAILGAGGVKKTPIALALKSIKWAERAILKRIAPLYDLDIDRYLQTREPYCSKAQLQGLLANGMAIGGHSIDHPQYSDLPLDEQCRQTRTSLAELTRICGNNIRSFAFPHTDAGVSRKFFEIMQAEGTLEISFGTSGPREDCVPMNFQRFSMEKTSSKSANILLRSRMRRVAQLVVGRQRIVRPD